MSAGVAPFDRAAAAGAAFGRRMRALWPLLLLVVAGAIGAVVPPLQSPDEADHLKRAYALASGRWLAETPRGGQSGYRIDTGLQQFIDANCYFRRFDCTPTADAARVERNAAFRWQGEERFSTAPGTGYYFPLIYLPQAAGLALGRAFDASIADSYRLARWSSLLAAIGLLLAAFRLQPPNALVLAVVLLPMVLFQMVSANQDGVATALAVFAASAFVRAMAPAHPPAPALAWSLAGAVFLLAAGRIHLLPMALLPLMVGWRHRSRAGIALAVVAGAAALAWFAVAAATTVDTRVARDLSTGDTALWYARHPGQLGQVLWATLAAPGHLVQLRNQAIGVLGWLDTPFSSGFYAAVSAALLLLAGVSTAWRTSGPALAERLGLVVAAGMSTALVFVAILFSWTPHPATIVLGVQGRYFLVPLLLVAIALSVREDTLGGWRGGVAAVVLAALLATVPPATTTRLLDRYWAAQATAQSVAWRQRPSAKLDAASPIVLTTGEVPPGRRIVAVEVLFGTYARTQRGRAELQLVRGDGRIERVPVSLATLRDNAYHRFDVPRGRYRRIVVAALDGGGVSVWEQAAADGQVRSCVVRHFDDGTRDTTPGCPAPSDGGRR
jgi:uncharacterized membrane protein